MKEFLKKYPLDPRGKSPLHQRLLLALSLLGLVAAACCMGVLAMLYGSLYFDPVRIKSYFNYPMIVFLNILPIVLLALLFFFLTNRTWLAFFLTGTITYIGCYVNRYVVAIRDEILVFNHLKLFTEAAGVAGEYQFTVYGWWLYGILMILGGTALLLLIARGRVSKLPWRFGLIGLSLAAMVGSFQLWYTDTELYNSFDNYVYFSQWIPVEKTASRGFIYPFVYSINDAFIPKPDGYSPAKAKSYLAEYEEQDIPAGQKVNFITMMLESYTDFTQLDVEFETDPYEALRPIWEEGYYGSLVVDSMGGGTINAERSFLTGTFYPHTSYNYPADSFVQYFNRQGYHTEGSHPGYEWFYNRKNVNANLGFSSYDFKESLYGNLTDEEFAKDDIFFEQVQLAYENRGDEPYFSYHLSYQNHSPYDATQLLGEDVYVAQGDLSDGAYYAINNYLYGVADTSRHIAQLIDSLRHDEDPVVLVFFGDHKPTLGDANIYYDELGINMNRETVDGMVNYYETPYFFWANQAAQDVLGTDLSGTGPSISPGYLMPQLFTQLGWAGSPYLQSLQDLVEYLPIRQFGRNYIVDEEFSTNLPENTKILLEKSLIMQYYIRDEKYIP